MAKGFKKKKRTSSPELATRQQEIELFKKPAYHADKLYASFILKERSSLIRLSFAQNYNGVDHFVSALSMSIEDIQRAYDVLGRVLQTMREAKRIE